MAGTTNTLKVFVVDDSALIRRRLLAMLDEIPMVELVGEAGDALTAIHRFPTIQPDLVLLDIELRGRSGLAVLNYITHHLPRCKTVVLSNITDTESKNSFMGAGAYRFFDKSLDYEQVKETIRHLAMSH